MNFITRLVPMSAMTTAAARTRAASPRKIVGVCDIGAVIHSSAARITRAPTAAAMPPLFIEPRTNETNLEGETVPQALSPTINAENWSYPVSVDS